ncbi:hypothetical protein RJ639_031728 [Escallonia herrerae]|uniref:Xylanase inhibitor C-terminal domain-containing protein n=1 Tax=Escallonia herrerae TaxID=1293975 RepID=A0AA88WXZ2_9ASTE|nr:hypothetical protein RJ639_031728 [Escallonia herrerae]
MPNFVTMEATSLLAHDAKLALVIVASLVYTIITSSSAISPIRFETQLIHHDSIFSPFYNATVTITDRADQALKRSISRLSYLKALTMIEAPQDVRAIIFAGAGSFYVSMSIGEPRPNREVNGVMGLGNGHLSLARQQGTKFSYCIGNIDDRNYMHNRLILGNGAKLLGSSTPLDLYVDLYYLTLESISFDGRNLAISPTIFQRTQQGNGGVLIDSGAELTYLVGDAYEALRSAVELILNGVLARATIPNQQTRLCYFGSLSQIRTPFPVVRFHFSEGATLELGIENLFQVVGNGIICLSVEKADGKTPRDVSIIGLFMQQNHNIGEEFIILTLYVDDMLVASSSMSWINELKKKLASTFSMKDWGEAKQLFGMRITRDRKKKKLWLSQEEYIDKVLRRFNLHAFKPVTTPLAAHFKLSKELSPKNREDEEYMAQVPYTSVVGSLMYAMISTRPDIAHAVGVMSEFMTNPGKEHWQAVKWILRYLRGTSKFCLCFEGDNIDVRGYVDETMQKIVALYTTEAEYVTMTEASKEIIWLQRLLTGLGYGQVDCKLWTYSQSAIHLAKNSAFHSRTKHIQLRYHFIRSLLEDGQLNL